MADANKEWYKEPIAIISFVLVLLGAGFSFSQVISSTKYSDLLLKYDSLEKECKSISKDSKVSDVDICLVLKEKAKEINQEIETIKQSTTNNGDYLDRNSKEAEIILLSQNIYFIDKMINENGCN